MRLGLFLVCLCMPAAALAVPRSAADCAAIENPFAYNACIAQFGPMAGQQHYTPAPPSGAIPPTAAVPAQTRAGPAYKAPARVGGTIFARKSGGRMIAEFQVGPSAPAPAPQARRSPRRRYYRR